MGGGGGDWPKASIGNYKGVMLCNRPNEVGAGRKADNSGGVLPFNSRVMPQEGLGWNPTAKLMPRNAKKKMDPNSILIKHRKFLKSLENKKMSEKQAKEIEMAEKEKKTKAFKENAAK